MAALKRIFPKQENEPAPNAAFILLGRDESLEAWGHVWPDGYTRLAWLNGAHSEGKWDELWADIKAYNPGDWEVRQVEHA